RQLGYVLHELGRLSESRDEYNRSLDLEPSWPEQADKAARYLAAASDPRARDDDEAVRLAQQVCQAAPEPTADGLELLADVLAELHRFDLAARAAQEALQAAERTRDTTRTGQLRAKMQDLQQKAFAAKMPGAP